MKSLHAYLILVFLVATCFLPGPPEDAPPLEVDECRVVASASGHITPYQALMWETKRREGFSAMPYDDIGVPAVGYGVRITHAEARRIRNEGGITEVEASQLTAQYYTRALADVDRHLPNLLPNQRLAVASAIYTMGLGTLQKKELWRMLKNRVTGPKIEKVWERTACGFRKGGRLHYRDNIAQSRKVESAMWNAHLGEKYQQKLTERAEKARKHLLKK